VTRKEIKYFWVENQSDRNPMSFREIITLGLHFDCKKWYAGVTEKVPGGDQPKFPYRRAAPLLEKNPDLPDLRFENPKGWLRAGRLSFGGSTNSTLENAIFKV
jgi:hypothetical protein